MKTRYTALALCVLASMTVPGVCVQAGEQQQSAGLVEDSHWQVLNRIVYDNRDYKNGGRSNGARNAFKPRAERNGYAEELAYGLMASFQSGFTQGTVGFGVDAHSYIGVKLDSGGGRAGKSRLLALDKDGHARDSFSRTGAAAKVRLSSTVLKYGEQRTKNPIFSSSDTRLLPETTRGWLLTSSDLKDFALQAGHFTGGADRNSNSQNNDLVVNYANPDAKKGNALSFAGGTWKGIPALSLTAYAGRYEDNWKTYYLGSYYSLPVTTTGTLAFDLNLYHSKDYGQARAGEIDNTTWSLMVSYAQGNHKLGLGYQKVDGDTPFDYVNRGSIWLGNAMQLSDFNAPREASWQLKYDYDLGDLLLPGLNLTAAYTRGSGIDGSGMDQKGAYTWLGYGKGGKHWERDLMLRYTVQDGKAKGLAFSLRHDVHRSNKAQAELDTNQVRFAVEYPLGG
ncbi:OprD family porin [Thiopseudomonas denitrificans]|uniref:Imipenem/basic amino acid-specific outer membrane pore n=1 Tax=Thiopseudomonas denitrificans TaxID=1501432 RepID=A0A4R6TWY6_9GAMM|nr:OprD family porin [Thiopseudomonas denitrificans]TDQ36519.1 imipenem/basic amino acid-specific outer membrane pore [Thiopseudomonas denitrificans]